MRKLSTEEMAKELQESYQRIDELQNDIKAFDSKMGSFNEAWNSSNANNVKDKINAIVTNLDNAKAKLNIIYGKITKTTKNITEVNAENFN